MVAVVMVIMMMVFGNPEFCSNSKCDVNKDEEGKQLPSSTSVHPNPHLGNNMQLLLPHQRPKP